MSLPDGSKSRALLIGTSAYVHLSAVPEIRNNLRELKAALERHTGLPPAHCRTLLDAPESGAVGREVEAATREASDLLLIYYSGHGLVGPDGLLYLTLPQTSEERVAWSGIPFNLLHHEIQISRAKTKVLILDCCFSGRAINLLSGAKSNIGGQITANGTFTLTSSPANEPSFSVDGNGHTVFTGALLKLLDNGSPRAGVMLTLGDLHDELDLHARVHRLPRPQKLGTNTAERLSLAANRHFVVTKRTEEVQSESTGPLMTAEDAANVQFRTVRLTPGYDEDEVDDLLDKVGVALADPPDGPQRIRAENIRNSQFTTTRMREGYDVEEVDSFLDRVELEFARRQALSGKTREPEAP